MLSDAEVLGDQLRKAREARHLSLDQAEKQTRIRVKYLEALEQGNYVGLPSAVQARGFLRNYARFLGLDADAMVAEYDQLQSGRRRRRVKKVQVESDLTMPSAVRRTGTYQAARSTSEVPVVSERPQRRGSVLGTLAIGTVALALILGLLFIGWLGLRTLLTANNPGETSVNPLSLPPTPTAEPTVLPTLAHPSALPPIASPTPRSSAVAGSGVNLSLQITERTWLRVIVDGQVQYVGSAAPGTVMQYQGSTIQLRVANAAGVQAILNGNSMGILGARGQIVDQTFTQNSSVPATQNAPKPSANSPGALNVPSTITQTANTSPGATFSLTPALRVTLTPSILPTLPPTSTYTTTSLPSSTPLPTATPSITLTLSLTPVPSLTPTPSITPTPSVTFTPSATLTPTNTALFLPHDTSTPESGEIRPK
ncbi:MAG: RodZ domain-containing protein [Chloroflexota bacterium]